MGLCCLKDPRICQRKNCKKKHGFKEVSGRRIHSKYCKDHTCRYGVGDLGRGDHFCPHAKRKNQQYCDEHRKCIFPGCNKFTVEGSGPIPAPFNRYCPEHRCQMGYGDAICPHPPQPPWLAPHPPCHPQHCNHPSPTTSESGSPEASSKSSSCGCHQGCGFAPQCMPTFPFPPPPPCPPGLPPQSKALPAFQSPSSSGPASNSSPAGPPPQSPTPPAEPPASPSPPSQCPAPPCPIIGLPFPPPPPPPIPRRSSCPSTSPASHHHQMASPTVLSCTSLPTCDCSCCEPHICEMKDCKKLAYKDGRCRHHQPCLMDGCDGHRTYSIAKDEISAMCPKHTQCGKDGCHDFQVPPSKYCKRHKCGFTECSEGVDDQPPFHSDFCRDHHCLECSEPVANLHCSDSDYCARHTCAALGCLQYTPEGTAHCNLHSCRHHGCDKAPSNSKNLFCDDHKCKEKDCPHGARVKGGYCETADHACVVKGCKEKWCSKDYLMCAKHLLGMRPRGCVRERKREMRFPPWMHGANDSGISSSSGESESVHTATSTVGTDLGSKNYHTMRVHEAMKTEEGRRAHRKMYHGHGWPLPQHVYHV